MRTIRALAAGAALASLLAASGPAAAKIMQLTLAGVTNGVFQDGTGALGLEAGNIPRGGVLDFIFTYDTSAPIDGGLFLHFTLLSARLELRFPDDGAPLFTPDGELIGSVNFDLNQILGTGDAQGIYPDLGPDGYQVTADTVKQPGNLGNFTINFPNNGVSSTFDQDLTYYPDPNSDYGNSTIPFYGNSLYDILLLKTTGPGEDYNFFTLTDESGAVSTRYVNFKDITPNGVPEPAAWALMLLGFGGLGAALRRRRAVGIAA